MPALKRPALHLMRIEQRKALPSSRYENDATQPQRCLNAIAPALVSPAPGIVIAMKIDRSGSVSFAIRGIPSPIRPPIRHSGEGRNPEGKGGTNHTQTPPTTRSQFHTSVCRHQPA